MGHRRLVALALAGMLALGAAAIGSAVAVAGSTSDPCSGGFPVVNEGFTLNDGQHKVVQFQTPDLILIGDPNDLENAFIGQGCIVQVTITKDVVSGSGPSGPFGFTLACSSGSCQLTETETLGAIGGTCVGSACSQSIPPCVLETANAAIGEAGFELAAVSDAPGGCAFFMTFQATNVFRESSDDGGGNNGGGSRGSGSGTGSVTGTAEVVEADPQFNG